MRIIPKMRPTVVALLAGIAAASVGEGVDMLYVMTHGGDAVCMQCSSRESIDNGPVTLLGSSSIDIGAINVGTGDRLVNAIELRNYRTTIGLEPRMYLIGARDADSNGVLTTNEYSLLATASMAGGGVLPIPGGVSMTLENVTYSAWLFPTLTVVAKDDAELYDYDVCTSEVEDGGLDEAQLTAFVASIDAPFGGSSAGRPLVVGVRRARVRDSEAPGRDRLSAAGTLRLEESDDPLDPVRDGVAITVARNGVRESIIVPPDSPSWVRRGAGLSWSGSVAESKWRVAFNTRTSRFTVRGRRLDLDPDQNGARVVVQMGDAAGTGLIAKGR